MARGPQRMVSGQVGEIEVALGGGRWPWGHCYQILQLWPIGTQAAPGWGVRSGPSAVAVLGGGEGSPSHALSCALGSDLWAAQGELTRSA